MLKILESRINELKKEPISSESVARLKEAVFILNLYKEHLDDEREKLNHLYDY